MNAFNLVHYLDYVIRTASYNYNVEKFFDKWLGEMAIEQRDNGGIPQFVPRCNQNRNDYIAVAAGWADAACIIPWEIYLAYGDKDLLAKNIAHLIRYQIIHCERDLNDRTLRQEHLMSLVTSLKQQAQLPENADNEHLQRDIDYHYRLLEEVTAAIERLSKRLSRLQSQIHAYHHSDLSHP